MIKREWPHFGGGHYGQVWLYVSSNKIQIKLDIILLLYKGWYILAQSQELARMEGPLAVSPCVFYVWATGSIRHTPMTSAYCQHVRSAPAWATVCVREPEGAWKWCWFCQLLACWSCKRKRRRKLTTSCPPCLYQLLVSSGQIQRQMDGLYLHYYRSTRVNSMVLHLT